MSEFFASTLRILESEDIDVADVLGEYFKCVGPRGIVAITVTITGTEEACMIFQSWGGSWPVRLKKEEEEAYED